MRKIRVLIVEDHPLLRFGLTEIFSETSDIECAGEADNGKLAVKLAISLKPDVVLPDLRLKEPMKNGFEVAAAIQQSTRDTKILIYSTDYNDPYIRNAIAMNLNGYITKDSAYTAVVNGIRAAAEGATYYSPDIAQKITEGVTKPESQINGNTITATELGVLQLLAQGNSNSDIANCLSISNRTVEFNLTSLFGKLGVNNRTEALVVAIENRIVAAGY